MLLPLVVLMHYLKGEETGIYSTNVGNRYIICQYEKSIKKNR
ncbi:hypothetical protein [Orientia tsutsugamushi]